MLRETVDDQDRGRFMQEARTLAGLSHINLVTVLDAGTSAERPYLVLELIRGRTLAEALRGGPRLPPRWPTSASSSPTHSTTPTHAAWSTATSNPPTCSGKR